MPFDDDPDDVAGFVPPLPPDDRLWRHPSEMASGSHAAPIALPSVHDRPDRRVRASTESRHLLVASIAMIVGVAAVLSALALTGALGGRTAERAAAAAADGPGAGAFEALGPAIEPALVRIAVDGAADTVTTGVVVRADGHILTTADAVASARSITVTTSDGIAYNATLVGTDVADDLAVVHIDRVDMITATISTNDVATTTPTETALGRSGTGGTADDLLLVSHVADRVRPWVGIASVDATNADLVTTDGTTQFGMQHSTSETSLPSPVAIAFDGEGHAVGITTARRSASALRTVSTSVAIPFSDRGLTSVWATPMDFAVAVASDLIASGHSRRPTLGATVGVASIDARSVDATVVDAAIRDSVTTAASGSTVQSDADSDPDSETGGLVVLSVAKGGTADLAGVRVGDVLTAIDDEPVADVGDVVVAMRSIEPGTVVHLAIERGAVDLVLSATPNG